MKRVIPIVLLLVLFASPVYAVSSPPYLMNKLSDMWEWTRDQMDATDAIRPLVFISSPKKFLAICERLKPDKKEECKRTIGLYDIVDETMYIMEKSDLAELDNIIIHEMAHALQHIKYGYFWIINKSNKKVMEDQAEQLSRLYIREMYGITPK